MYNVPSMQVSFSLSKWLDYIDNLHDKSIDLGLERVRGIAIKLGLLHPAMQVIIVGGTNGKGTTCRLVETILLASKIRVGVYSSPHLLRYTERLRIQGKELSEYFHVKAMEVIEYVRGSTSLSYFEFSTLSALYLCNVAKLDVVILEVGLGGRLDATNVVDVDISVITNIDIDHVDLLGFDRHSIAKEKAGIFRNGKPAVVGDANRPNIIDVISDQCGSILLARNRDWGYQIFEDHWYWWNQDCLLHTLPLPIIAIDNAATALAAVYCLPFIIPEKAIRYGLRIATLPGRFQIVMDNPLVILDVAHNPHAACYLAYRLEKMRFQGKILAVVGMLINKNIYGTLYYLRHLVTDWYCASLNLPLGANASQLVDCLDNVSNIQQFQDVASAWSQAMIDAKIEDCVLVFGSFRTVAAVMELVVTDGKIIM